ncbi:carboxymuconolactone decarboxylase family protein [Symbioplanes lichenis]|uniref:carboxymuconolactone decarboxylase family protein n=1 Tax=Symbioplanes lichenis TaxID=1629072 RepID=UPI002738175B|nr:carboxymuconolactone decarboxylase family protein [Actinoplanes lichenis]
MTPRQHAAALIGAFTATGRLSELREALAEGLDAGLTVNEVKEILVQLYAYAGFPRSLNALGTFMALLDERRARGFDDPAGAEPGPLPADRHELGAANQAKLTGGPVTGPLFDFAPAIDEFLKGHLFGDIFGRDNLDWPTRELATVGALASLDGVESQLQSHLSIARNVGFTEAQLRELLAVVAERAAKS